MYTARWAVAEDLPALTEYWRLMAHEFGEADGVPIPSSERVVEVGQMFAAELEAGRLAFRVAVDKAGTVVACAGGLLREEYAFPLAVEPVPFGWVISVYTLPEHRGQGLATRLTDEVCGWLKEKGACRARLWASSAGRPVYARLGFKTMFDMAKPL